MGFKTDGSCHKIGVENEKQICSYHSNKFTNINKIFANDKNVLWKHEGGTQQKRDACAIPRNNPKKEFDVSIKHVKNGKTGSFDWINTTSIGSDFNEIRVKIDEFKKKYFKQQITVNIRNEMNDILSSAFEIINNRKLELFLERLYEKYPKYILVANKESGTHTLYDKEDMMKTFRLKDIKLQQKTLRSKTSRAVFKKTNNGLVDTGLRIRLVLNNGLDALLGNKKGKTSSLTLKIQQDQLKNLLGIKFLASDC
jgi:hypothetical protein